MAPSPGPTGTTFAPTGGLDPTREEHPDRKDHRGGQSFEAQVRALRRGVDVVVATPGRAIPICLRFRLRIAKVGITLRVMRPRPRGPRAPPPPPRITRSVMPTLAIRITRSVMPTLAIRITLSVM